MRRRAECHTLGKQELCDLSQWHMTIRGNAVQDSFFTEKLIRLVTQIGQTIGEQDQKVTAFDFRSACRVLGILEHSQRWSASRKSSGRAITAHDGRFVMAGIHVS